MPTKRKVGRPKKKRGGNKKPVVKRRGGALADLFGAAMTHGKNLDKNNLLSLGNLQAALEMYKAYKK